MKELEEVKVLSLSFCPKEEDGAIHWVWELGAEAASGAEERNSGYLEIYIEVQTEKSNM